MKKRIVVLIAIVVIVISVLGLTTLGQAQNRGDLLYLPVVFGSGPLQTQATWGDTPTPAPTMCPGFWDNGVCDPTPTPRIYCFGVGLGPCPTETPTPTAAGE